MLISKIKMMGFAVLSICTLSLPVVSQANLTVINNTDHPSTSKVNGGKCSSAMLGPVLGVTAARSTNFITDDMLKYSCLGTKPGQQCMAEVYMTNNCMGPIVATAWLDKDKKYITNLVSTYVEGYVIDYHSNTDGTIGTVVSVSGGPS